MAQETIGVGSSANDGTGDPLRSAFQKVNSNFTEVYQLIDSLTTIVNNQSGNVEQLTPTQILDLILTEPYLRRITAAVWHDLAEASETPANPEQFPVPFYVEPAEPTVDNPYPVGVDWDPSESWDELISEEGFQPPPAEQEPPPPEEVPEQATEISITAPTNRLIGETYTAVIDLASAPLQWRIDGVDVVGATSSTFVPTVPGRVTVRSGSLISDPVWARKGPSAPATNGFSGTTFTWTNADLGADYPHKVLYALFSGTRAGGVASFEFTLDGTTGHQVGSTFWDGTSWAQLYVLDNPGVMVDVAYGSTDLTNTLLMLFTAGGFVDDAVEDIELDQVDANNSTSASVTITNSEHALIIAGSINYDTFPEGPELLHSAGIYDFLGEVQPDDNTDRAMTATRVGSASGKKWVVASIAPKTDEE